MNIENDIAQEKILERLNTPVPALDESKRVVIRVDRVYGNLTYYPECDNGRIFAAISGKKTLTHDTLRGMSALGYWFQFKTLTEA